MNTRLFRTAPLLFAMLWAFSCADSSTLRPVPTLAESLDAQRSFLHIREQWSLSTEEERVSMEPTLEAFRMRHASDPLARIAEAYLAFIALYKNDVEHARTHALRLRQGPMGNTRDLGILVDGAILARKSRPNEALRLLEPLVGKVIDSFAQQLLHETVVTASIDARRWYQAVVYMNEWVRNTHKQDHASLLPRLDAILATFPPQYLESTLRFMKAPGQEDHWETKLRETVATRLATMALERSDPDLAQSVLDTTQDMPVANARSLAQLAFSGKQSARIVSARVGWIMQTDHSLVAGRSSQATTGALEVFRPGRNEQGQGEAPILIAHNLDTKDELKHALDALTHRGVSILIGGFDPTTSSQIASFAESESIPALLLVAPEKLPDGSRFTFVMGIPELSWERPSDCHAASQVDAHHAVRIGIGEPANQRLDFSCQPASGRVEDLVFPISDWRKAGVKTISVDGPSVCARRLLRELRDSKFAPSVYLGLEAREAAQPFGGTLHLASSGQFDANPEVEPDSLRAWRASLGHAPTWFQALGRDAALLAHEAVTSLPRDTFTERDDVMRLRSETQQRLVDGKASLWTTNAEGFDANRILPRTIRFVEPKGQSTP